MFRSAFGFVPAFVSTTAATLLTLALPALGLLPGNAHALDCGSNNGYTCTGTSSQYAGGFNPGVGNGGFGGSSCTATGTPMVFIPGNGDSAISFDMPPGSVSGYTMPASSVYDELRARGYNDCELFGITYLDADERATPQYNYHEPAKYQILKTFIDKVKTYTGRSQVDIVAHSMGSSMTLAMLRYYGNQGSVRRFINIGGGLRGLNTCYATGYQSAYAPTCNAEAYAWPYDYYTFGFYPNSGVAYYGYNRWTGSGSNSLRAMPALFSTISYYTITAGIYDQVHCFTTSYAAGCSSGALFNAASNVKAQVDIGFRQQRVRLRLGLGRRQPLQPGRRRYQQRRRSLPLQEQCRTDRLQHAGNDLHHRMRERLRRRQRTRDQPLGAGRLKERSR